MRPTLKSKPRDPLYDDSLVPPHNLDAERCVIGSVIIDPSLLDVVAAIIGPADFHAAPLGTLFGRLIAMRAADIPFESPLIVDQLKTHGEWWQAKESPPLRSTAVDAATLAECCHAVAVSAHAIYYADIVRDASYRRRLIRALQTLANRAYDPKVSIADLSLVAANLLRKVTLTHVTTHTQPPALPPKDGTPGAPSAAPA